jgi:hypothetical protein
MNKYQIVGIFLLVGCFIFSPKVGQAQISATADYSLSTGYSSGTQDQIYVFCVSKGEIKASLTASCGAGQTGNFVWSKYNASSGSFDFFSNDLSGNQTSSISNLADGCYRVKITTSSGVSTYTAWVFNNYEEATAAITNSDCSSFTLSGTVNNSSALTYVDLSTGSTLSIDKTISVTWKSSDTTLSDSATLVVSSPPSANTDYTFTVTDRFGCTSAATVEYVSVVPKAAFTYVIRQQGTNKDKRSSASKNEAPLTVAFTNTSVNADAGKYQWYFYKDVTVLAKEKPTTVQDSLLVLAYDDSPEYTYEACGEYNVKLIASKTTTSTTCTSYCYIDTHIKIDTSFIDAPNIFLPDVQPFAVRFFSMKSVKITILDRWGKVLHTYQNGDIEGFYDTATTITNAVWDGKIGGRLATPGVYFWIAEGVGRDGTKRRGNGFFHLFRDK